LSDGELSEEDADYASKKKRSILAGEEDRDHRQSAKSNARKNLGLEGLIEERRRRRKRATKESARNSDAVNRDH